MVLIILSIINMQGFIFKKIQITTIYTQTKLLDILKLKKIYKI